MTVAPGGRCAEFLRLAYEEARQYCVCDDVSDAGRSFGDRFRTDGGEVLDPLGLLHGRLEWRLPAHWSLAAIESSALAGARRPGRGDRGACSAPCGFFGCGQDCGGEGFDFQEV